MKTLISITLLGLLTACGVEVKDPSPKQEPTTNDDKDDTSTNPKQPDSSSEELPLGLCSFETKKSRGCLKASIASTQLVIGPFNYQAGIREFTREFLNDLVDSEYLALEDGETLGFVIPVTTFNFHNGFYGVVEGQGVTYEAFHTGSGNMRIDNVVPGYYGVTLIRDFDLKITNSNGKIVEYLCASMYTRRDVSVQEGKEAVLGQQINEFELNIYEKSCSGLSVKK